MSSDDEVQKLLERTRARRERINKDRIKEGLPPQSLRSPLREVRNKNTVDETAQSPSKWQSKDYRSPIKTTAVATTPLRASPSKTRSPIRTTTSSSPLRTSFTKKESLGNHGSKEESYNREVTEKKTTIEDPPVLSPSGRREHYKKTTITEKEEVIKKSEVMKITETGPHARDGLKKLTARYGFDSVSPKSPFKETLESPFKETPKSPFKETPKSPFKGTPSSPFRGSPLKSSPLRRVSPRKASPVRDQSPKAESPKQTKNSPLRQYSPMKTRLEEEEKSALDDSFFKSRRNRLAALAKHINQWEDQSIHEKASNPLPRTPETDISSGIIDVDAELEEKPPTKNLAKDEGFIKSLKAQGFEETNSKTKLVCEFGERGRSPFRRGTDSPSRPAVLSSPTRNVARPRSSSPHKPHPLQFVSPQKQQQPSTASPYRASPKVETPRPRSVSPHKIHPLQFVSPVKAKEVADAAASLAASTGPPKPNRTFAATEEKRAASPPPIAPKPTWKQTPKSDLTDTASRRSMLEKRSMFESGSPRKDSPDPAMLPLSQRKALFEKNKSFPKPIARFGESVTPAMLSRAERPAVAVPASEPTWKRKRDLSPMRSAATPSGPDARFESKRKLFEVNKEQGWRGNDIAQKIQEEKKKEMDVILNRFKHQKEYISRRSPSPPGRQSPERPSPKRSSPMRSSPMRSSPMRASPMKPSPKRSSPMRAESPSRSRSPLSRNPSVKEDDDRYYPGVNSMKRIRVSPPKPGQLYPDLNDVYDESSRPGTSMSDASEAPSLGTAIKRAASIHAQRTQMPSISEDAVSSEDEMEIDDVLDEALDMNSTSSSPPTARPMHSPSASSSASSSTLWEFQTPNATKSHHNFKTPLVEAVTGSPQAPLAEVEGGGANLMHSVSMYRKQKPVVNVNIHKKIVRNVPTTIIEEKEPNRDAIRHQISKLDQESREQEQRMEQASKALNYCESKDEFVGSSERVEGELLLLEASHKHAAAKAELQRLKTEGAMGKSTPQRNKPRVSKGCISLSGLALPLKKDFIRLVANGDDEFVHYFVVLVKYKAQVIATQMLSSVDGIAKGKFCFTNLIKLSDLDFDFEITLEVYGLQTRKEVLSHEEKYHLMKKEKSMFNLTPLKKIKKQETRHHLNPRTQNPVNAKTIRRPSFGLVGITTITIGMLSRDSFKLDRVPDFSPLQGTLEVKLNAIAESRIEQQGFLTLFKDVNGLGNWCRRWGHLSGNQIRFWKYPDDETLGHAPTEVVYLSGCITDEITLAPKEVSSRAHTFMLETRRPIHKEDRDNLVTVVNRRHGFTTLRHLFSADSREERIEWCDTLNEIRRNLKAWDPSGQDPIESSDSFGGSLTSISTAVSTATSSEDGSTEIW